MSAGVSGATTEALVGRLFSATIGALELASIHLGLRLGFYTALEAAGSATSAELAERTGTTERYVREWLEQQAVARLLGVDDVQADAAERRYRLPAEHRPVFLDPESLNHLAPLANAVVGVIGPMQTLIDAYKSGGGVPYEAYGADTRDGIAAGNRPMFAQQLAGWLAAIPEVHERLIRQPPALVADVACGVAWSSIAMARAYPHVIVDAIDADPASIHSARIHVRDAGLRERVRPSIRDASDPLLGGRYDLVTIFEALHDMNHPVDALRSAYRLLKEGGSVVVADERVAEHFTAPGDDIERFNYGWSVLHCLPVGMLEPDSAGTGTVMRPDTVRAYAAAAGFNRTDVLPIEHDLWRFYRLVP